jgi:archaellum biogenesis ATPase FlaH
MQSIWLGERTGDDRVSPDNLGKLKHCIAVFAREHKNGVVVIDGLEYLALFNDFRRLNVFYEELNDIIMYTRAVLLMPIDERLIEASDMARLKRFAEIV